MLDKMQRLSNDFYRSAIAIGCHPFIEFCGLMNEYIKTCQVAHLAGIDFTQANAHSGIALPIQPHNAAYLGEKLTGDEMYRLFDLVDSDPPGGDFWEALGEQAEKARPDKFGRPTNEKEEIEVHPDELDETSFETLGQVVV